MSKPIAWLDKEPSESERLEFVKYLLNSIYGYLSEDHPHRDFIISMSRIAECELAGVRLGSKLIIYLSPADLFEYYQSYKRFYKYNIVDLADLTYSRDVKKHAMRFELADAIILKHMLSLDPAYRGWTIRIVHVLSTYIDTDMLLDKYARDLRANYLMVGGIGFDGKRNDEMHVLYYPKKDLYLTTRDVMIHDLGIYNENGYSEIEGTASIDSAVFIGAYKAKLLVDEFKNFRNEHIIALSLPNNINWYDKDTLASQLDSYKYLNKVNVLSRDEYVAAMNAANAISAITNISISVAASKMSDCLNALGVSLNTKKKTCPKCKHFNECDCSAYNDGVCDSYKEEEKDDVNK